MATTNRVYTNPQTPAHVRSNWAALQAALDDELVTETELDDELEALFYESAEAQEDIDAGEAVYISAAGQISLADASAQLDADGFAVADISSGATGQYATGGFLSEFSGLTPGAWYFLSATTPGAIVTAPDSETSGTDASIIMGKAITSTKLWISIQPGILY